jgi:hypothetical protein
MLRSFVPITALLLIAGCTAPTGSSPHGGRGPGGKADDGSDASRRAVAECRIETGASEDEHFDRHRMVCTPVLGTDYPLEVHSIAVELWNGEERLLSHGSIELGEPAEAASLQLPFFADEYPIELQTRVVVPGTGNDGVVAGLDEPLRIGRRMRIERADADEGFTMTARMPFSLWPIELYSRIDQLRAQIDPYAIDPAPAVLRTGTGEDLTELALDDARLPTALFGQVRRIHVAVSPDREEPVSGSFRNAQDPEAEPHPFTIDGPGRYIATAEGLHRASDAQWPVHEAGAQGPGVVTCDLEAHEVPVEEPAPEGEPDTRRVEQLHCRIQPIGDAASVQAVESAEVVVTPAEREAEESREPRSVALTAGEPTEIWQAEPGDYPLTVGIEVQLNDQITGIPRLLTGRPLKAEHTFERPADASELDEDEEPSAGPLASSGLRLPFRIMEVTIENPETISDFVANLDARVLELDAPWAGYYAARMRGQTPLPYVASGETRTLHFAVGADEAEVHGQTMLTVNDSWDIKEFSPESDEGAFTLTGGEYEVSFEEGLVPAQAEEPAE